jgi:hypothetical protein
VKQLSDDIQIIRENEASKEAFIAELERDLKKANAQLAEAKKQTLELEKALIALANSNPIPGLTFERICTDDTHTKRYTGFQSSESLRYFTLVCLLLLCLLRAFNVVLGLTLKCGCCLLSDDVLCRLPHGL